MLDSIRRALELLYFASGIVLAVAAVVGLRQLRIARFDVETRNRRASLEHSIRFIDQYNHLVILAHSGLHDSLRTKKTPVYDPELSSMVSPNDQVFKSRREHVLKNPDLWLAVFNSLECVSAGVNSGLCDDEYAFKSIGVSFCSTVASVHDIMQFVVAKGEDLNNTLELFERWRNRVIKQRLLKQHREITDGIHSINDDRVNAIGESGIP